MPVTSTSKDFKSKTEAADRPTQTSHGVSGKRAAGSQARSNKGTSTVPSISENRTSLSDLPIEGIRPDTSHTQNEQVISSDISEARGHAAPPNPPLWDWQQPWKIDREPSGVYYELQGELLQEQERHRAVKHDFSIPYAVEQSPSGWPSSGGGESLSEIYRPARQPTAAVGLKRKSTSGHLAGMTSEVDGRTTRATSESMEGPRWSSEPSQRDLGNRTMRRTLTDSNLSMILPARKVFPVQIGDKLFRLSGASISSDAPSYFTRFFEEQLRMNDGAENIRTLYIDRDPATFVDIALHLQGYHIEPRDGPHFVKLFADAQFFSLPRLTNQLFSSPIYVRIGDEEFQIPRDLFDGPGNSPNYFSLGFSTFFSKPSDAFPGLSQRSLVRPPSILPPSIPQRSAKTFADILHILKGYPVEIRNDEHREELLRDARYFNLKGLEQRLIPHEISYSLARERTEILVRLEDIQKSGISFVSDGAPLATPSASSPASSTASVTPSGPGWIFYQRPYIDTIAGSLIVEIASEESTSLTVESASRSSNVRAGQAKFFKQTLAKMTSLFSVIAKKTHHHTTSSLGVLTPERSFSTTSLSSSPRNAEIIDDRVKCRIGPDADVVLNGKPWTLGDANKDESVMDIEPSERPKAGSKRKKHDEEEDDVDEWIVRKAQWRLRIQPASGNPQNGRSAMEIVLGAVKIDAYSDERWRNAMRGFLQ